MNLTHWTMKFAVLAVTAFATATLYLLYLLFLEPSPLEYNNIPFPAKVSEVRAGQTIPIAVSLCNNKKQTMNYTLSRSLVEVNTRRYVALPSVTIQLFPGCKEAVSLVNTVPEGTATGTYRLVGGVRGVRDLQEAQRSMGVREV